MRVLYLLILKFRSFTDIELVFSGEMSKAPLDCILCYRDTIALKTPKSREKNEGRRYFDYCGITTTEYKWTTKIHTGDDILIMKRGSNTQGERFVKNLKMMISKVNNQISINPSSQDSQASSIDIADQIKKLADLKTQGILTEEEFVAQKKKLLGL